MANMKAVGPLPAWVLLAVRAGTPRQTAIMQATLLFLVAVMSLGGAASMFGSDSTFGRISFFIQLPTGCITIVLALWTWLGVRWVDKKGQWQEAA
jgi:hypothetical protein